MRRGQADGSVQDEVVITGSKAQLQNTQTIANAVALTNTNPTTFNVTNWNNYNRHALLILNSHDQAVDIYLKSDIRNGVSYDNLTVSPAKTVQKVTIPANSPFAPILITDTDLASLRGLMPANVQVLYAASVAPTSGSITIKLIQWAE